ncbi:unnamed protein product [Lampetra planeri]
MLNSSALSDSELILLHYNYTGKLDHGSRGEPSSSLGPGSLALIAVCCVIAAENLLVMAAIACNGRLHTPTYCFVFNLALSDLLAAALYAANVRLSGATTLRLSRAAWFAREGAMFVALGASVFSLLAIAVERYATMLRMRLTPGGRVGARRRAAIAAAACWAAALVLGALPSLGWNCVGRLPECSAILPLYAKSYLFFCVALFSLILATDSVLYARIYCLVRRSGRRISSSSSLTSSSSSRRRRPRRSLGLLRTLALVVGVFITCWSPLFALLAVDVACDSRRCPVLLRAADYAIALAVLNSATNPIIYAACSRDMRQAFTALVCCLRGERSHASRRGSSGSTSGGRSPSSISSSLSVRPGLAVGDAGATMVGAAKMVPSSLEDRDRVPYSPSFSCSSFSTSPSPSNNNNALASPSKVVVMMMVVATAKEATTDPPLSGVFVFPEPVKEEDVTVER